MLGTTISLQGKHGSSGVVLNHHPNYHKNNKFGNNTMLDTGKFVCFEFSLHRNAQSRCAAYLFCDWDQAWMKTNTIALFAPTSIQPSMTTWTKKGNVVSALGLHPSEL